MQNYTPIQIQTAYGLNLITAPQNKPLGYGIKLAIINIYHYSNLQNDLNKYCSKYNLKPITLNIINQAGNLSNYNWALQANLATQIVNTVAPGATVYVIEAKSTNFNDIKTAVSTAVNLGVNIISMGFGTNEFSTESSIEHLFVNSNILFCVAAGDNNTVNYPSSSANVVSVGGSNLLLNSNNTRSSETAWSQSACGTSLYTVKPSYQSNVNSGTKRNIPDVALVANGFTVYSSINGGYLSLSSTSLSCPLFAAIMAVANQFRKVQQKPMLTSVVTKSNCLQNYLYKTIYANDSLYHTCMYDIITGSSGNFEATTNYDIATGLGSVNANTLCAQLVNL